MTWLFSILLAADPAGIALRLPVDCDPARCSIQKFVDHDAGPGRRDFRCGTHTTDGHDGTDIRLRRFADLGGAPVAVLAAADGAVARVRDGMPDRNARAAGDTPADRMAGNAVVIAHPGGWETQYSHLRQGSVAVRPGRAVRAGEPIGAIGMSGFAEFPHLHFEVRRDGATIDPFSGATMGTAAACDRAARGLWGDAGLAARWAPANDVLAIGFATGEDDARGRRTATAPGPLPADPPALIVWADVAGLAEASVERFVLTGPDGAVLVDRSEVRSRPFLSWFAFAGVRRPPGGWRPGRYAARYLLSRDGATREARAEWVTD